jgi:rod shape-determining protein MreC
VTDDHSTSGRWMAVLGSLVGAGLCCLPTTVTERVRAAVRDAVHPGQVAMNAVADRARSWLQRSSEASGDSGEQQRKELEQNCESLRAELTLWKSRAALAAGERNELAQRQALPAAHKPTRPLVAPDLIAARVLGIEGTARELPRPVLDVGADRRIESQDLVLKASAVHLDAGQDLHLETDHPVVAGQAVVGRIETVGHWTSTVQLVTDEGFRGSAQLLRETDAAAVEGATGVLHGLGDGRCRLELVPGTEPVREGDLVVTPLRQSWSPDPYLYGTVTKASLEPGALHWVIEVSPACDCNKVETVGIFRTVLNPHRVAGQAKRSNDAKTSTP